MLRRCTVFNATKKKVAPSQAAQAATVTDSSKTAPPTVTGPIHSLDHSDKVKIFFVTPDTVAMNHFRLRSLFGCQFGAKVGEIVWKPEAAAAKSADAGNPALHIFAGLGAKPNSMTLMKSAFAAVRKARELQRSDVELELPRGVLKHSDDCTLTDALELFSSQKKGHTGGQFLNVVQVAEKLSTYAHLAGYEYNAMKTGAGMEEKERKKVVEYEPTITIVPPEWTSRFPIAAVAVDDGIARGKIIADGANTARTWQNIRPDVGTPAYFAEAALQTIKQLQQSCGKSAVVRVADHLKGDQLAKSGLNLMHAVGKGASDKAQPHLLVLEYIGNHQSDKTTALVGKGVVMDTGGLNVKPYGSMETMNQDMGGAAAVFAAFKASIELKLEQNIVCVLGFANNACGHNAYQPSEIIRSLKGTTVEVLNTDAEGRLVLADALTFVQKHADTKKEVDTVINVATLTGAMCVALGESRAGFFSNDAALARNLVRAADTSLEPIWPMPIGPEHHKLMKGTLSDLINCAPGRYGGACSAAAFLQHFIEKHEDCLEFKKYGSNGKKTKSSKDDDDAKDDEDAEKKPERKFNKWAHLDIAGPGMGTKATDRNPAGSTGFGAMLLTQYFRQQQQQQQQIQQQLQHQLQRQQPKQKKK